MKLAKNFVVYLVALFSLALLALWYEIVSPQRQFKHALEEVSRVQVGDTRVADWRNEVEQANLPKTTFRCAQELCSFSYFTDNRILHDLHLAPLTSAEARVDFRSGVASEIRILMEVLDSEGADGVMYPGTGATVSQGIVGKASDKHFSYLIEPRGSRSWAIVMMDKTASPKDRANALAVSATCLSKIGGCNTPSAILPQVFPSGTRSQ